MDVYEITGYATGVSREGVNFLQPADAFQNIIDGYIYRQVLQSRQGIGYFAPRLAGGTRILGIFEHILPNSSKELLAADTNHLYKFNIGTGVFDQIPFAGSMAGYAGFNVTLKDHYISGTSYPTASNTGRFVFTGEGITLNANNSAVFFYDGTDVKDFCNVADNPNYQPPALGAINRANYVIWFNERLNLIYPTIASTPYPQGVLYSGIRTSSGNGDKFNVAGSGLFQADTYLLITGATILGQLLLLNFNRMAYTMEKTTDAFNPYFGRAVPGVLGTDAKFSAVSWAQIVMSMGKTGILGCDGQQNLKADNKIPYFTADEIDQIDFNLTYGGFDRVNEQFLWAYKEEGAFNPDGELTTQNKVLALNYKENTFSVYNQRFSVFGQTDIGIEKTWDEIDGPPVSGNESWSQWDTTEEIWDKIGIESRVQKTLAGDDFGNIYQLNQDYDDYYADITAITQASQAVLTVSDTAILPGDLVVVSNVEGMVEINNFDPESGEQTQALYTVQAGSTSTSIILNVDSTNFTAYTSGGHISKVIEFSAETIPFNPYRDQGRRCYVSHVEFLIETNGGNLLVDVYEDQQEAPFKSNVLLQPTLNNQRYEWLNMVVDQEANFLTFKMKQTSPAVQVRLVNMRIHCAMGGYTSG